MVLRNDIAHNSGFETLRSICYARSADTITLSVIDNLILELGTIC
jgi:hypothetical protein